MSNIVDSFIDKKDAESPFLTIADGESVRIKQLQQIKQVTKVGYSGDEVDCLRLVCLVETEYGDKVKNFDNSSARFAREVKKKGVDVDYAFTMSREGEKQDTTYTISDLVAPAGAKPAAAPKEEIKPVTSGMSAEEAEKFMAS